jgi:hypothetical protein
MASELELNSPTILTMIYLNLIKEKEELLNQKVKKLKNLTNTLNQIFTMIVKAHKTNIQL